MSFLNNSNVTAQLQIFLLELAQSTNFNSEDIYTSVTTGSNPGTSVTSSSTLTTDVAAQEVRIKAIEDAAYDDQLDQLNDDIYAIVGVNGSLSAVQDSVTAVNTRVKTIEDAEYQTQISTVSDNLTTLVGPTGRIKAIEDQAYQAQINILNDNVTAIVGVDGIIDGIDDDITAVTTRIRTIEDADYQTQIDTVRDNLGTLVGADGRIKTIEDNAGGVVTRVTAIEDADYQTQITTVSDNLATLVGPTGRIKAIEDSMTGGNGQSYQSQIDTINDDIYAIVGTSGILVGIQDSVTSVSQRVTAIEDADYQTQITTVNEKFGTSTSDFAYYDAQMTIQNTKFGTSTSTFAEYDNAFIANATDHASLTAQMNFYRWISSTVARLTSKYLGNFGSCTMRYADPALTSVYALVPVANVVRSLPISQTNSAHVYCNMTSDLTLAPITTILGGYGIAGDGTVSPAFQFDSIANLIYGSAVAYPLNGFSFTFKTLMQIAAGDPISNYCRYTGRGLARVYMQNNSMQPSDHTIVIYVCVIIEPVGGTTQLSAANYDSYINSVAGAFIKATETVEVVIPFFIPPTNPTQSCKVALFFKSNLAQSLSFRSGTGFTIDWFLRHQ